MFPGALIFNAKQLNEIFKLDKLVIEAKGQSAVINNLAIFFFNSENLRKLAQNDEFCSLHFYSHIYLLPLQFSLLINPPFEI